MSNPAPRHRLRRAFQTTTAAAVLAATPMTPGAAQTLPSVPAATEGFHRDQGICPAPGANARPAPPPYDFAASPREQQRLLASIGMDIGRETPDGVFRERTLQSLNEFRNLYYGPQNGAPLPFVQSLNAQELADLREFSARVLREKKQYGLTLEAATALRFAARGTDAVHATLVTETNKGRSGYTGTMSEFLYLVKTQGVRYGLGHFANRIQMAPGINGATDVRVDDAIAFTLLESLRRHPRVSIIMEAEQIRLGDDMPEIAYRQGTPPAGIELNRLQGDLLTLGFSLGGIDSTFGPKTEAAYNLYRALYSPLIPTGENADAYLSRFADLAQRDARTFGIPTPAAAAIRLANLRTGVDFGYLMELSSAESNFDHAISASTSSANGLMQFTEDTWAQTINRYGDWYDMTDLAAQMETLYDMNGLLVGRVENPFIRTTSFDLRSQPHIAALMGAEFQQRNKFRVECTLGRSLNRTDMYFAHFLGAEGAITFLQNRARNPNGAAATAFPQQAAANRAVFYSRDRRGRRTPRSYDDVYSFFSRKFDRAIYEDAGNVAALGIRVNTPREAHINASRGIAPQASLETPQRQVRYTVTFGRG